MTDLLSIGASSTQLYRVALSTVSNNIANLNNEAYSRQETAVSDNAPARIGAFALGTGARLDAIRRNYDRFVENALRQSNSALQLQQPLIEYTQRIVDVVAAEEGSLTNAVDRFFTSVNRLELDPSSISSRNELLASGQFLTGRMRGLADELADMERETASLVRDQVGSINTLAKSLLEVNRQLDKVASLQKQPSQLLDQRDKLLREPRMTTAPCRSDWPGPPRAGFWSIPCLRACSTWSSVNQRGPDRVLCWTSMGHPRTWENCRRAASRVWSPYGTTCWSPWPRRWIFWR
jgi:flagellar hook-associated protein 1 FlgK